MNTGYVLINLSFFFKLDPILQNTRNVSTDWTFRSYLCVTGFKIIILDYITLQEIILIINNDNKIPKFIRILFLIIIISCKGLSISVRISDKDNSHIYYYFNNSLLFLFSLICHLTMKHFTLQPRLQIIKMYNKNQS